METIADLDGWWLEITCRCKTVHYPLRLMAREHGGEVLLGDVVRRLRCKRCGKPPATVDLIDDPQVEARGNPNRRPAKRRRLAGE
jgi:hypothetical protein